MPSPSSAPRRARPALTPASLDELALSYVGKFATSRAKLAAYLSRKLRERGWDGPSPADPRAVADRMGALGYVDDQAFASARARSMLGRGYGERRVDLALHAAGIAGQDQDLARREVEKGAVDAAIRFARRRRIGPFAHDVPDPKTRERQIAAMLRAGHPMALVKRLIDLPPGSDIDPVSLENE
ncbi:RecX family transcriptional regulator [Sphingomonas rhizophila]|uniref:RecX family transcriptional regulator n=2 Tax=Sphingomonas rhizophila TaxID=2071607 RepID=A0A7G9SEG3_9SPHN|nr:RecX family transcriptional regulator [Sphingomonas rhizophila]